MRIGFFTDAYLPSKDGVAISVETFRQKLEEQGHEVYVFCPKASGDFEDPTPRIKRFRAHSSWWFDGVQESWPINPRIYLALRKLNLDIVHTHTQFNIGLLGTYIAKTNHIPLVTTCHADFEAYVEIYRRFLPALFFMNMMMPIATKEMPSLKDSINTFQPERSIGGWNKKLVRQLTRHYASQCNLVISPSQKIADMLIDTGVETPVEVIETGVDHTLFKPTDPWLRQKYDLAGKQIVLYSGRVKQEKNIELVIRGYAHVHQQFPDSRLVLVGPGTYIETLQELVHELGIQDQVIFTGGVSRDQVLAAMKEADIFAFASVTDTQGLVIDEAVLAGLPLILVDQEVSQTAIAGRNALFADNTPESMAQQLQALLASPELRFQLGQGSMQISQEFDADKQAIKLLECYQELIDNHAQPPQLEPIDQFDDWSDSLD